MGAHTPSAVRAAVKALMAMLTFVATASTPAAPAAVAVPGRWPAPVRIATSTPALDSNPGWTWVRAASSVLESGGLRTRIYPGSTVGTEIERIEQVALGLLELNESAGSDVLHLSPALRTLRLPFLVDGVEQVDCLLRGTPFLERVAAETRPHGVVVLDVLVSGGMSGLFLREPQPLTPGALDGRRIRVLDRIQILTVRSWGAAPINVPWEEVQTALQTGIVDGYLNPPGIALQFRHERQLRQFVDLRVAGGFRFITASTRWLDGLDPPRRALLERALDAGRTANRAHASRTAAIDLAGLRAAGVQVVEPTAAERRSFLQRSRAAYDSIVDPQTRERILPLLAACAPAEPNR
jgi:TRAP-type transport system periplasmic protein